MSFEPQPLNPLGWIILLLVGIFSFFLGYAQVSSTSVMPLPSQDRPLVEVGAVTPGPGMPPNAELLGVRDFEIHAAKGNPPQISVAVSGYWPDGCNFPSEIQVTRTVDIVTIRIFRITQPNVMCTQMLQAYSAEVALTGIMMEGNSFRSGSYTIDVNGVLQQASF